MMPDIDGFEFAENVRRVNRHIPILFMSARDDLPRALSATRHYNRLLSLGFQPDLDFCLTPNRLSAVCERAEDGWFYRI